MLVYWNVIYKKVTLTFYIFCLYNPFKTFKMGKRFLYPSYCI